MTLCLSSHPLTRLLCYHDVHAALVSEKVEQHTTTVTRRRRPPPSSTSTSRLPAPSSSNNRFGASTNTATANRFTPQRARPRRPLPTRAPITVVTSAPAARRRPPPVAPSAPLVSNFDSGKGMQTLIGPVLVFIL